MCRLCYIPQFIDGVDYVKLFEYLQTTMGGQGNGIGGFIQNDPVVHKGVMKSNEELYRAAQELQFDKGFLYHTRLASWGAVCDYHTHPFVYNNVITCHNGTWTEKDVNHVKRWLVKKTGLDPRKVYPMNDSRLVAYLIGRWGFDQAKQWKPGVVLSLDKERCMTYVGGSLELARFGKQYIYASSIPQFVEDNADEVKTFARGSVAELGPTSYKILEGGEPYKNDYRHYNIYTGYSDISEWNCDDGIWACKDGKWAKRETSTITQPEIQTTNIPILSYEETEQQMHKGTRKERKRARKQFLLWKDWYTDEEEKRDIPQEKKSVCECCGRNDIVIESSMGGYRMQICKTCAYYYRW